MTLHLWRISLILVIVWACSLFGTETLAISIKKYPNELVAEADYVIIGSVENWKTFFKEERDDSGEIIPTVETEDELTTIKVDEVLFANQRRYKNYENIFILQKRDSIPLDSALFTTKGNYLLFLKEAPVDTAFARKHNLPTERYFSVIAGNQGQVNSVKASYIEATRELCKVRKIKDRNTRLELLQRLRQLNDPILREAVEKELLRNTLLNAD